MIIFKILWEVFRATCTIVGMGVVCGFAAIFIENYKEARDNVDHS